LLQDWDEIGMREWAQEIFKNAGEDGSLKIDGQEKLQNGLRPIFTKIQFRALFCQCPCLDCV
jgi:hypothetical protein